MRAVEIDDIPDKSDGLVLEEIRKGFMINNEIVRVAEVKVNRIRTMESCKGADL
jgi:molecular chaperone GrpE